MSATAIRRLAAEFSSLTQSPVDGIVARPTVEGEMFKWSFAIAGPEGCPYAFGVWRGTLTFPEDYPLSPPKMVFETPITHPNVYPDGGRRGEVCISILHTGTDITGYERPEERWSCVHGVRSVLLSVASILAEPNAESPANVDAANLMVRKPDEFRAKVAREVRASLGLD